MNQPPKPSDFSLRRPEKPPSWCRPAGVAPGTWDYVHQGAIADHYDDFVADVAMANVEQQILRDFFPPQEKPGDQTMIDLGCGTGRTAIPLAQAGYDVIGVDLSQTMLQRLSEKAKAADLGGKVAAVRANLVELDCLADHSADHAVCLFSTMGMIAGRKHRRQMLSHVHRIVRPGGIFLLHVHHRWAALREKGGIAATMKSIIKSFDKSEHEFGDSVYEYRGLDQMFMHRFGRMEIERDLQSTGWQVEHCLRLSIDGKRLTMRLPICGGFFVVARAT
ncbi:class I SAM-dependent methyltransferase [Rubripirellula obstinata]|nr:class I SAM-dependent methyltransferase [Rubripirellula obstinata]